MYRIIHCVQNWSMWFSICIFQCLQEGVRYLMRMLQVRNSVKINDGVVFHDSTTANFLSEGKDYNALHYTLHLHLLYSLVQKVSQGHVFWEHLIWVLEFWTEKLDIELCSGSCLDRDLIITIWVQCSWFQKLSLIRYSRMLNLKLNCL